MGKERKTDRRYAITNIPGDPGLSDAQIAAMRTRAQNRSNVLLENILSVRGLSAEAFLRKVSRQEDTALSDEEDFGKLMQPSWNL